MKLFVGPITLVVFVGLCYSTQWEQPSTSDYNINWISLDDHLESTTDVNN